MSTDNKNGSFTRRSMLAGAGALAAATFLPAASATADSDDPFMPEPPTAERPYYYIKYDETTKAANPERSPIELVIGIPRGGEAGQVYEGKIVVLHCGNDSDKYSGYQKKLIMEVLEQLAPTSNLPILLVDVSIFSKDGKNLYVFDAVAYINLYNHLGKNGERIELDPQEDVMIPYGKVAVPKDVSGDLSHMAHFYDFTLMNFAGRNIETNEALRARAIHIFKGIGAAIQGQNQLLAELENNNSNLQTVKPENN